MTRKHEIEGEPYMCRGCGRPEDECSLNPCRAVLVERAEELPPADDSDVENCWAESDADCDRDEKGHS